MTMDQDFGLVYQAQQLQGFMASTPGVPPLTIAQAIAVLEHIQEFDTLFGESTEIGVKLLPIIDGAPARGAAVWLQLTGWKHPDQLEQAIAYLTHPKRLWQRLWAGENPIERALARNSRGMSQRALAKATRWEVNEWRGLPDLGREVDPGLMWALWCCYDRIGSDVSPFAWPVFVEWIRNWNHSEADWEFRACMFVAGYHGHYDSPIAFLQEERQKDDAPAWLRRATAEDLARVWQALEQRKEGWAIALDGTTHIVLSPGQLPAENPLLAALTHLEIHHP